MNSNTEQKEERKKYISNLTLTGIAGLVGLITMVIILAAVFGGLWLDNYFGTRPRYTLVLVIVSMPVTLVLMFAIVRSITKKIEKSMTAKTGKEIQYKEENHFE